MEPTLGEIGIFGGNFAPRGWAFCDGQLLPINQNQALFSILGTTYGGDGRTTFALPDLRGRMPIGEGTGPGLTPHSLGSRTGQAEVTLTAANVPAHTHTVVITGGVNLPASSGGGDTASPSGAYPAESSDDIYSGSAGSTGGATNVNLSVTVGNTGGGQAVNNLQPYTVVRYIIALQGLFPPRN